MRPASNVIILLLQIKREIFNLRYPSVEISLSPLTQKSTLSTPQQEFMQSIQCMGQRTGGLLSRYGEKTSLTMVKTHFAPLVPRLQKQSTSVQHTCDAQLPGQLSSKNLFLCQ